MPLSHPNILTSLTRTQQRRRTVKEVKAKNVAGVAWTAVFRLSVMGGDKLTCTSTLQEVNQVSCGKPLLHGMKGLEEETETVVMAQRNVMPLDCLQPRNLG